MPAIITHHIFGEDAGVLLPDGILSGQEELLAFLLGNQGTGPFWARFLCRPRTADACQLLASRVHTDHMTDVFWSLHDSCAGISEADRGIGRAFSLGVLAHFLLDSFCNPLICAITDGLIEADPTLEPDRTRVYALIGSDIDSWMLWQKRQQTVLDAPCVGALSTTARINAIAGAMVAQMSWEVFGLEIGAPEYGCALNDLRLRLTLIEPPATRTHQMLERLTHRENKAPLCPHRIIQDDECAFGNLDHHVWRNSVTKERSVASSADLFHDALLAWPALSSRFLEGDRRGLDAMVAGINYYGEPTERPCAQA